VISEALSVFVRWDDEPTMLAIGSSVGEQMAGNWAGLPHILGCRLPAMWHREGISGSGVGDGYDD